MLHDQEIHERLARLEWRADAIDTWRSEVEPVVAAGAALIEKYGHAIARMAEHYEHEDQARKERAAFWTRGRKAFIGAVAIASGLTVLIGAALQIIHLFAH